MRAQISKEPLYFFIRTQNGSSRMAEARWCSRSGSIWRARLRTALIQKLIRY
jgi:hypothetical protein